MEDHIFAPEAFDFVSKTVPLVMYVDGERRVIGTAELKPDSEGLEIESRITDPEVARVVAAKAELLAGFAIFNPPAKPQEGGS